MTERKNFLERWSRKKAEAQREAADAPPNMPVAPNSPATTDPAHASSVESSPSDPKAAPLSPAAPKQEFDLARLPSLESITGATDIRDFLAPGVPQELSRAALRRAWLADPAIRDFVGLQENDWDFTNPAAVPGFGDMPPGFDVKKMIAEIFGEADRTEQTALAESEQPSPMEPQATAATPESPPARTAAAAAPHPEIETDVQPVRLPATDAAREPSSIVQSNNDIATQQDASETTSTRQTHRRHHGGALPQS
jgi:hypothetical protein